MVDPPSPHSDHDKPLTVQSVYQDMPNGGRLRIHETDLAKASSKDVAELRTGKYMCAACGSRTHLVVKKQTRMHFSHASGHDPTTCPFRSKSADAEILRAARYDGIQESRRHRTIVEEIAAALRVTRGAADVSTDTTLTLPCGGRRRPDVYAVLNGQAIACEVQVSYEFPHFIAERDRAYADLGIPLIYVFDEAAADYITATDEAAQNSGFQVIWDEPAKIASQKRGHLNLSWRWRDHKNLTREQVMRSTPQVGLVPVSLMKKVDTSNIRGRLRLLPPHGGGSRLAAATGAGALKALEAYLSKRLGATYNGKQRHRLQAFVNRLDAIAGYPDHPFKVSPEEMLFATTQTDKDAPAEFVVYMLLFGLAAHRLDAIRLTPKQVAGVHKALHKFTANPLPVPKEQSIAYRRIKDQFPSIDIDALL